MRSGTVLKLEQNRSISDNPMRASSRHEGTFSSRDRVGCDIRSSPVSAMDFLPWTTFTRIVDRYGSDHQVRTLSCAKQYRAMAFAHLRRHLPRGRQGRGPGPAALQHPGHDPPPAGALEGRQTAGPRRRHPRSGRLAWLQAATSAEQHHSPALTAPIPRAEPGRERLAVHPRQLALKPGLQVLCGYPRPLLLCMKLPHRPALENHLYRNSGVGLWVMINEKWYQSPSSRKCPYIKRLLETKTNATLRK